MIDLYFSVLFNINLYLTFNQMHAIITCELIDRSYVYGSEI